MKLKDTIIPEARGYVQQLMAEKLHSHYLFHNFDHIQEVFDVCRDLVEKSDLSDNEAEETLLAALFRDTGHIYGEEELESCSIGFASKYLRKREFNEKRIKRIVELITHSCRGEEPVSLQEKILHDAVWSFLGMKQFKRKTSLLKIEKEYTENKTYTPLEWYTFLFELLIGSKYYTTWAEEKFFEQRSKNITEQEKNLNEARKEAVRKNTGKDFGRGVDTMFRVTSQNHMNLSSIADGKANMIISINTLVLSILITAGSAGYSLTDYSSLESIRIIIPGTLLMLSSLLAIVFAVLSATPKVSRVEFTENQIREHQVSMLYFGNFLQLDAQGFVDYLRELKRDQEILYDDMAKDLYNLGKVLQRKYKLITIAYRVFIGGLIISVLSFLLLFFVL